MSMIDVLDMNNPYPNYKKLREKSPIVFDDLSKYWIVSKYKDVSNILRDENNFSAEIERINYKELSDESIQILDPINFIRIYGLSSTENPTHDKVKKVLMPIFNDMFKELVKPIINKVIKKKIDKAKSKSKFDIIKEVFYDLPAEIIFQILGIPESEIKNVKKWSESRMFLTWGDPSEQTYHAKNIVKYWNYCVKLVERKRKNPQNDLPSYLILAHLKNRDSISINEITLLCYGLVFSGHTTTTTFLSESLKLLLENDKWKDFTSLGAFIPQTCNEMLRLCPSAFTRRRVCRADINISGVQFSKGDKLLLSIGSANRDEEIFEAPNEINFNRKNSNHHLTLGRGFHYCIGAKLVHLEYSIIFKQLSLAMPNLKLSLDNDFIYHRNLSIRSLDQLVVENL